MFLFEGLDPSDTIVAISTPPGIGGIGVIRLSGQKAHAIGHQLFRPKSHRNSFPHRQMILGDLIEAVSGNVVDEVFLVFMRAPHTYTREDMVEIQCHSGSVVLEKILSLALDAGARLAGPGEFTLRAYLNGRIDLTQAEGVIEIIQARSEVALGMAQRQLHGKVREAIETILAPLRKILMYMEADLDFSGDTGMDFFETWRKIWETSRSDLFRRIERLMEGFATCQMMREGVEVVILGRPNVGKSSLLNRFVGQERAIVTEIPGTTRDFIEEGIRIRGIPFKVVDTAGLRSPRDPVERIGTEKTQEKMRRADVVLLVIDGSQPLEMKDRELMAQAETERTLVIVNKSDLPMQTRPETVRHVFPHDIPIIAVSAKTGQNWQALEDALVEKVRGATRVSDVSTLIPVNQRHYRWLKKAHEALQHLDGGLDGGAEEVFLAQDVGEAVRALEAIVGTSPEGDVLSQIFRNFCIGK